MYTFEDLLNVGAGRDNHETVVDSQQIISLVSGSELANAGSLANLQAMFPGTTLNASPNVVYFPYRLCHSLPSVNSRRRAFTPQVLQNSFASALDQLIDLDHELEDNGQGDDDKILGFTKAISFPMPSLASSKELAYSPADPLPVNGLGMLWTRARAVQGIVNEHASNRNWRVSMECGHDWGQAYLRYRDEFIPIKDAEGGMLECIKSDGCTPYKGHELAVMLGGLEGKVDFWGAALTTTPADKNAKVLQFVSGYNRSIANMGKKVFMPIHFMESQREVANQASHERIIELASIAPIGETDPADDGHTHIIMGDMTIMPSTGHDHYLMSKALTRGTNPTLTGVTDSHAIYIRDSGGAESRTSHAHSINVPLKGKFTKGGESSDTEVIGSSTANQTNLELAEMKKSLTEIMAELAKVAGQLASEKDATKHAALQLELAKSTKDLEAAQLEMASGETVKKAIDEMVKNGTLLTKEKAEELVSEEKKKQEEAAAAAQLVANMKLKRTETLNALGINLAMEYPGLTIDGKPVTVQGRIDAIPYDDNGQKQFDVETSLLSGLVTLAQAQVQPAEGVAKVEETQHAEAANVKAKAGSSSFDVKRILALAGGGAGGEEANSGGADTRFGAKPAKVGKHNGGIHLLTSRNKK